VELTYYTSGGSGDAGDQYTGLDRFGRVVDQRWDLNGVDLERLKYGYDQASNQVWRQNTVAEGLSANQDQYYTQDGLYQIKTLQRGTLNATQTGISGTPSWEEDWNYDPLGNWNGSTGAYQTRVAGTTTLNQNRAHSKVNEITNITESTGPAWPTPGYDAAGNMTSGPQPLSPANGYALTYDAWNRLVQLKNGNTVAAAYAYDGASRRTTKTVGNTLRHYYYDDQWRVAEERLDTTTTADRRFVWGIRRLDDLILRDASTRLYAVDDKINVTAVVDANGTVQERYGYNGFGGVNYMNTNFGSIPVSAFDWETLFDSYRYDTESGLYQVRYRYFHSLLGRWLTRDPIGEKGGINLYAYVGNSPVNFVDPRGESTLKVILSLIPILGTIYNLVTRPKGSKASDYTVSLSNCDIDRVLAEETCKANISIQAASYQLQNNALNLAHELIDAFVGLLAKVPIAILVLAIDAVVDLGAWAKGYAAINAGSEAAKKDCKCSPAKEACKNTNPPA
jgi:RHS repeat-associated protein